MTEELKNKVNKIINYCGEQADIYNNYQLGAKVQINSIYGAFGFSGFYFYNPNIAESVTKQGKNAILNAERLMNLWAQKIWLKDEKTHKKMGIKITKPDEKMDVVGIYCDTDSCAKDTCIDISDDVIIIETNSGDKVYNMNDIIKIIRDDVEMEIETSKIQKYDILHGKLIDKVTRTNKITIEQLYNLGKNDKGSTLSGHESVNCDYKVLNVDSSLNKYFGDVERVIRHKVSKSKWKIEDSFGNIVFITNDHSIMVMRNDKLIKVKPYEIDVNTDKLVSIYNNSVKIGTIVFCDNVGNFDDEYVYDIEMSDDNHTFIANNMLVHNSVYSSYYQVVGTTDWMDHPVWRLTKINKQTDQSDYVYVSQGGYPTEDDAKKYFDVDSIDVDKFEWSIDTIKPAGREFCLTLNRVFMSDFLKKIHEEYAKKNGTPNILDFELETYTESGIWLAKKKYIKNMTWTEPNVYYDSCTKIKATGVEIAQTSSSIWVKTQLTNLVKWIFQQEEFTIENFIKQIESVKKAFMLQSPEIVSVNKGMNKYSEYVLNDTDSIEMAPKAMVTVQGAALYNYIINNNDKLKRKYSVLFDADKLCVLYIKPTSRYTYWKKETQISTKEVLKNPDMYKVLTDSKQNVKGIDTYTDIMSLQKCEAFSYPAGMYPMDIAENIEIDYNRMFELLVLGPVNRIIEAMGYRPVDINMTCENGLW